MHTKQVIVLRKDLKMRRGKEVAQGAHASMAAILNSGNYARVADGGTLFSLDLPPGNALSEWLLGRFTKICVTVQGEDALKAIHAAAVNAGLPAAIIQDSGLTEFGGVPTYTAVAIGPAEASAVDAITGELPLY